jgi:hypothetical protein
MLGRTAITALLLSCTAGPALAQPGARIDAEDAISAFNDLSRFIRNGNADAPAPAGLPGAEVAGIIVTLDGRIVAEGFAATDVPGQNAGALMGATRTATRAVRRTLDGAGADPANLMISLEIGFDPRSLLGRDLAVPAGDWSLGVPAPAIRPGIEGLMVRSGETRAVSVRTPAWMIRRAVGPTAAVAALATELTGDPEVASLGAKELGERGFAFSAFRVVHLAQIEPRGAPVFLHRGGRVIRTEQVAAFEMPWFATMLAAHLRSRLWPGIEPLGMVGTLDPIAGRYDPPIAPPVEQALAAAASLAWADAPNVAAPERSAATAFAHQVLADLAQAVETEPDPAATVEGAAATIIALTTPGAPTSPELGALSERCAAKLDPTWRDTDLSTIPPAARGLVALAAARAAATGTIELTVADRVIDAAYASVPPEQLVSLMPFLGWASVESAEMSGQPVRAAAALRAMRDLTDEFRITAADVDDDGRDLVGGIVFTAGRNPLPTWNTLRPAAFEATMLGRSDLTPGTPTEGELPRRLSDHARTLRFLGQLTAVREEAHAYRRPAFAIGGVRRALWDHTMPSEASALALWTLAETLTSIENIEARGTTPTTAPNP